MDTIWTAFTSAFEPSALVDAAVRWSARLVAATAIMLVFYLFWRAARRALRVFVGRTHMDATALAFMQTIVKILLLGAGTVAALGKLGFDASSLLASLGVVGLTLGFAAKDALSNMISGIFIFWDRPFVIGDLVDVGGQYGRVDAITMRSTRIVTPDGRMLAVPNTVVVNTTVASYTNFPHLRVTVAFTVGVAEDLGRVRRTALSACEGVAGLLAAPAPEVVVIALNDYNVALELYAWLDDEKQHLTARPQLRERVFEALRGAGVDMPCETLSLNPVELRTPVAPSATRPS